MPFGTIWGIKHLNMNLEHFCTSLSALFNMYSLNMSKVTNSTRFSFGSSCIFPKICQNKAKKYTIFAYIYGQNLLSKMAQKLSLLLKNKLYLHNFFSFWKYKHIISYILTKKTLLKYLCTHTISNKLYLFTEICQTLPQLINYSWAN